MKSNCFGFDFSVLDVDLVAAQNNWYIFAHSHQIFMPCWHVFICDTRSDVKHNDGALALNVVTISQTAEFLLTSCVPYVECDWSSVCGESQWMYFDAECGFKQKMINTSKFNICIQLVLVFLPTYFFSNSPVKCLLTNVVFPTPPSPTSTS